MPNGLVDGIRLASPVSTQDFDASSEIEATLYNVCSEVSSLEAQGSVGYAVLKLLSSTGQHDLLLPNMRHIYLRKVDLRHHSIIGRPRDAGFPIETLRATLDDRYSRHGLLLDSLSLEECEITEPSVGWLTEPGRWSGQTRVSVTQCEVKVWR
ncbi:hypothetical protein PENSPDRAFT_660022 [Peniophora sp. CONT]|nr:hypothetical protein PENSPDRAFT_660022 [Peniophora sp. CONT]